MTGYGSSWPNFQNRQKNSTKTLPFCLQNVSWSCKMFSSDFDTKTLFFLFEICFLGLQNVPFAFLPCPEAPRHWHKLQGCKIVSQFFCFPWDCHVKEHTSLTLVLKSLSNMTHRLWGQSLHRSRNCVPCSGGGGGFWVCVRHCTVVSGGVLLKQVTALPWHFTPKGALFGPIYGIYV